MENLNNQRTVKGANIRRREGSNRPETPPPTYDEACVAANLSNDIHESLQGVPMTVGYNNNGASKWSTIKQWWTKSSSQSEDGQNISSPNVLPYSSIVTRTASNDVVSSYIYHTKDRMLYKYKICATKGCEGCKYYRT